MNSGKMSTPIRSAHKKTRGPSVEIWASRLRFNVPQHCYYTAVIIGCQQAGDRSKGVFYENGQSMHNTHYAGFTCHALKIGNLAYQLSRARRRVILSS